MLFTGKNNREYESPILIIRDELGIKMKDLCEQAGCSPTAIYNLAYGNTWPVYVHTWKVKPYVEKLADILGVSIEELFPLFYCKKKPPQIINEELYISEYTLNSAEDTELRAIKLELIRQFIKIKKKNISYDAKRKLIKQYVIDFIEKGLNFKYPKLKQLINNEYMSVFRHFSEYMEKEIKLNEEYFKRTRKTVKKIIVDKPIKKDEEKKIKTEIRKIIIRPTFKDYNLSLEKLLQYYPEQEKETIIDNIKNNKRFVWSYYQGGYFVVKEGIYDNFTSEFTSAFSKQLNIEYVDRLIGINCRLFLDYDEAVIYKDLLVKWDKAKHR